MQRVQWRRQRQRYVWHQWKWGHQQGLRTLKTWLQRRNWKRAHVWKYHCWRCLRYSNFVRVLEVARFSCYSDVMVQCDPFQCAAFPTKRSPEHDGYVEVLPTLCICWRFVSIQRDFIRRQGLRCNLCRGPRRCACCGMIGSVGCVPLHGVSEKVVYAALCAATRCLSQHLDALQDVSLIKILWLICLGSAQRFESFSGSLSYEALLSLSHHSLCVSQS